ncbi:MAG: MFS transporter [Thermoanaerobaculum sp.]
MCGLNRSQWAWCLYDWANSAFALACMTALLPPLLVRAVDRELGAPAGTVVWGWLAMAGMALSLAFSPPLGAWMDAHAKRRWVLAASVAVGALSCLFVGLALERAWPLAGAAYVLGASAFALGNVAYDALLPGVAPGGDVDRVSAVGYSLGYLGGAVALVLALVLWRWGSTSAAFGVVGLWWGVFAVPVLAWVPEPPAGKRHTVTLLANAWRKLRANPRAVRFLLAYWLYNDGIGTVIKMAGAYGGELGLPLIHVVGALLLAQVVGVPATLAFGWGAPRLGCKRLILLALVVYLGVALWGVRLSRPWEFWALAAAVGTVQGGAQALSRSLFARFVPEGSEAAFFSFFDVSGRFAGLAGPALFAAAVQVSGSPRAGVLVTAVFFLAGGLLLVGVKESGGASSAAENP